MGAVCSTERSSRSSSSTDQSWFNPINTLLAPSKKRKSKRYSPPPSNLWHHHVLGDDDDDDTASFPPDSSDHSCWSRPLEHHHHTQRLRTNGSTSSACAFSQQGQKGVNQDAFLVWENFAYMKDTVLCAVFDGHGPDGHLVARKVRDSLPFKLMAALKARMGHEFRYDETDIDVDVEGSSSDEGTEHRREIMLQRNETTLLIQPVAISDADINVHMDAKFMIPDASRHGPDASHHDRDTIIPSETWRDCILRCCTLVDRELKAHAAGYSCLCSGTTAVILLKQDKDLIIGNIGDSRAVLARTMDSPQLAANGSSTSCQLAANGPNDVSQLEAVQLTVDLKPNISKEIERIERCKGRVFALDDEPEVSRLWLPHDDAPGLAMARAFGDFCLKDYGLISVPEMSYRKITASDKFVILATDGIWDVLSNMQAVQAVSTAPSRASAAQFLVETAVEAWRMKYPTSKIDDCAAICLFFSTDSISPMASSCRLSRCLFSGTNFHGIEGDKSIINDIEADNGCNRERDTEEGSSKLDDLEDQEQTASHARSYSLCWRLGDQVSQQRRKSISNRDNHQKLAATDEASTSVDGDERRYNCVMKPTNCFGTGALFMCQGVKRKENSRGSGGNGTMKAENSSPSYSTSTVSISKERQQLKTDENYTTPPQLVARADSILSLPRRG